MTEEIEILQKKLRAAITELPNIINDSIRANAGEVIRMNVDQHLKGQTAKGSKIGAYADSTKRSRRKKGLQISFVDLEDTKNYHGSFAIAYLKDRVELASPEVPYAIFLDNRYKDLFGLMKENLERLSALIGPLCEQKLNSLMS